MASALELLNKGQDTKSALNILGDKQPQVKSALGLLNPDVAPTTSVPIEPTPFNLKEEGGLAGAFGLGATPVDLSITEDIAISEPPEETPEEMELSWRQDAPSALSKLVDSMKNAFVSKSDRAAKATISLSLAEELEVNPSDLEPGLIDSYLAGLSGSPTGLIRQVESGKEYPQIDPKVIEHLSASDRLAMGVGGFAGMVPYLGLGAAAGGVATGGNPIGAMMGAFALTEGLRSYYMYKMDNGEVDTPGEFFNALKETVKGTVKGAITGVATGKVGMSAKTLGVPGAKLGAEVATMTTVGSALEGQMPSRQDFLDTAIILYGVNWMMRAPNAVRNLQTMYKKTGMRPKQMIEEAKIDPDILNEIAKDKIPDEVIKYAKEGVEEIEQKQAELLTQAAVRKAKKDGTLEKALNDVVDKKAGKAKEVKKDLSVFKRMPEEELKKQADYGVEGAKVELADRLKIERIETKEVKPVEKVPARLTKLERNELNRAGYRLKDISKMPVEEQRAKLEQSRQLPDPITESDLQTGTETPATLTTENHPFRDIDSKYTESTRKAYDQMGKEAALNNPETLLGKMINETNRWLNGEEVPIDQVKAVLNNMYSRSHEYRHKFDTVNAFEIWKEKLGEVGRWASQAERPITDTGVKLYDITGATGEAAKEVIKSARGVADYMKKARGSKGFKPAYAAKMTRDKTVRAIIDKSGNIRREMLDNLNDEGYRILQKMYLTKGAPSIAIDSIEQMGKEVYSGLNKSSRDILDTIVLSSRMVDLSKYKTEAQLNIPEGKKFSDFAAYLRTFKFKEINGIKDLTDKEAHGMYHIREDGTVGGRAGAYFNWMRQPLKDMLDAQLITENEFKALSSHNYRKTKLVDLFDNRYEVGIGKSKKRTVYDSGIDPLAKGREVDIYEPSSEVMALEVFNRAYGRVLNNEANLRLLDLARKDTDNPFVKVKEGGQNIPSGWQRFFVFEEGKRKAIYLSPEMSKEWIVNSPDMSYKLSQVVRYASGAPMLRMFATGINWGFAVANLPRDVQHLWFASRVFEEGKWKSLYSSHAPMYAAQMGKDMIDVFPDVMLRRGEVRDYIQDGGGMEFLTLQGRPLQRGRHVGGPLDKLLTGLGYFGESSELLTRLSIRRRVIKRRAKEKGLSYEEASKDKDIRTEASFAARDYMDFGQGGWLSKAADNAFPYLNAGLQGTRGMVRAFKPGSGTAAVSAYKLAQYAGIVSGAYIASHHFNPKTMDALEGSHSAVTNMCVPLGDQFSFIDDKGQTRYIYLKMPLDPGQRFFKTFFEASTDKWLGNEVDVDKVTASLKETMPFEVDQLPPTMSAAIGYMANKDFWYNEDIWKKTDPLSYPKSKEEFIPGQTPQMYTDIGEGTGLSPERTRFAVGELTAGDNLWTNIIGRSYEAAFGDLPKSNKEMDMAQMLSRTPVIRRFIGITNPYTKWAKPIDEARENAQLDRWVQNRGLDVLVEGHLFKDNVEKKEITNYMRSFKDLKVYDRMMKDYEFQVITKDLNNRSFWLGLKRIPDVEGRAKVYAKRWNEASPIERGQIRSEFATVELAGGVISSEFLTEVAKYIE